MKKYILFGAGNYGKQALAHYGIENVAYFVDNNQAKHNTQVQGIPVISFEEYLNIQQEFQTIITVAQVETIAEQLQKKGIVDFGIYTTSLNTLSAFVSYVRENLEIVKNKKVAIVGVDLYTKQLIKVFEELGVSNKPDYLFLPEWMNFHEKIIDGRKIEDFNMESDIDCYIVGAITKHLVLYTELKQKCRNSIIIDPFRTRAYYDTDEIVFNPYGENEGKRNEEEWNEIQSKDDSKQIIRDFVDVISKDVPLFQYIEIETINRCNGNCSFCPVNHNDDPRTETFMTWELFKKIIGELESLDYDGELSLFSNNEPLLDKRIVELHRYAREHLPNVRIHMFTNGTLFTLDLFQRLIPYLDELIIDNYQQELRLIRPNKEIADYIEQHPELRKKVTIVLRKPNEILTSRGGDAPNRKNMISYENETCALPFEQMIVRPDGKVSLCCNDPLGRNTLGDLNKESITDVWYGQKFQMVRKCLKEGRKNWEHCRYCDTFYIY